MRRRPALANHEQLLALYDPEAALPSALAAARRSRAPQAMDAPADLTWRVPPPGVPGGAARWGAQAESPPVFRADTRYRPGDRVCVRMAPLPDADQRQVVLLRLEDEAWQVRFPTRAGEILLLSQLPQREDGSRTLDLRAWPPAGRQRWAVALPDRRLAAPLDADPGVLAQLQRDIERGEVPCCALEIDVAP